MLGFRRVPIACRSRLKALRGLYVRYYNENIPEARGLRLLRAWLSSPQLEQFNAKANFDVIGCDTGKRYRIFYGTAANVYELDDTGRFKMGWCFVPQGCLVAGDVMLAQKIALETSEFRALSVAMKFVPSGRLRDDHLERRVLESQPTRWNRFRSNANRGEGTIPAILVIVIQLGLMLGAVGAERGIRTDPETSAPADGAAQPKVVPTRFLHDPDEKDSKRH
jgi:hypothetical protein